SRRGESSGVVEQGSRRGADVAELFREFPAPTRLAIATTDTGQFYAFSTPSLRAVRVITPMNSFIGAYPLRILLFLVALATTFFHDTLQAEEEKWQLAMNNAELRDIVEEISNILGTTVVL